MSRVNDEELLRGKMSDVFGLDELLTWGTPYREVILYHDWSFGLCRCFKLAGRNVRRLLWSGLGRRRRAFAGSKETERESRRKR
jgi:hypothetical protein